MADRLASYRRKRDFTTTEEPAGGRGGPAQPGGRFVIQEHHATRLHWDLRLERDGVLVSWAVPNGIPEDPGENRKAVHTEDHPLEYLEFEGDIPRGNYGAGRMRIWDRGSYECHSWTPRKRVISFHGERVQGLYALFQAGGERDWMLHRIDPPADPGHQPLPEHVVPMLAGPGPLPADDGRWALEIKWDGVRAIAHSKPGRLRLESRNLKDITARYPELRSLNRALSSHAAVLDGEIVAFDEAGRPSFQRLQRRMHLASDAAVRRHAQTAPVTYVIFDLLHLDGRSLLERPYEQRRAQLAELGLDGAAWRTPAFHRGEGAALLQASRQQGLEGVVAKRLESVYEPGRRSRSWIKVKNSARQELVIGGWVPGEGRRQERIGALLLGVFEGDDGAGGPQRLRYAGRVGTGFDDAALDRLARLLAPLRRATSPFAGHRGPRGARYVEPVLVAEVEFTEWTSEGLLRHPSYKGLRDDRDPRSVIRERAHDDALAARPGTSPGAGPGTGAPLQAGLSDRSSSAAEVRVGRRTLRLTGLDRVVYPRVGFTQRDVLDFYRRVAPALLPHLQGRGLLVHRYPAGTEGQRSRDTGCPGRRPSWLSTVMVGRGGTGRPLQGCLVEELAGLVWVLQRGGLELYAAQERVARPELPSGLCFEVTPIAPLNILDCADVALRLRDLFDTLGLRCWAKTSGAAGLEVHLPLNDERSGERAGPFARAVAETLARAEPELVMAAPAPGARGGRAQGARRGRAQGGRAQAPRPGRVVVDPGQTGTGGTLLCPYSLRAGSAPAVSTPLAWAEIEAALDAGEAPALCLHAPAALARIEAQGDLFAEVLTVSQALPALG